MPLFFDDGNEKYKDTHGYGHNDQSTKKCITAYVSASIYVYMYGWYRVGLPVQSAVQSAGWENLCGRREDLRTYVKRSRTTERHKIESDASSRAGRATFPTFPKIDKTSWPAGIYYGKL